jgi:hypothetical protein
MPKLLLVLTSILIVSVAGTVDAQAGEATKEEAISRSPVRLLPGYKLQIIPGVDAQGGKIWKDGGFTINFFSCCMTGPMAADVIDINQVSWREEQTVQGQVVLCAYNNAQTGLAREGLQDVLTTRVIIKKASTWEYVRF